MSFPSNKKSLDKEAIKRAAEADLLTFIKLIAPKRVLGAIHEEIVYWWQRDDALDNQLLLLPRDHQKSALIAYRVAWHITKHPEVTVLYISATSHLAELQLKFIKDIFTSDIYQFYWPEMVNKDENKRERWSVDELCVDHPRRKSEGTRDATIRAVGLTANTTGAHCNVAVLDDIVVPGNAYTELGRSQVRGFYSQLASIETTGASEWAVGTRYHPGDIYRDMIDMKEFFADPDSDEDIEQSVYEVFERQVETNGEFLWPKQRRSDGKTFGFDERALARKKAKYLDITQFYAQYYNNPNNAENSLIDATRFQYYDRARVVNISGAWYYGEQLLAVYGAIDFAYSVSDKSDYTAIVIVGVTPKGDILILDIDRFKTNKISVMYERCATLYRKWSFRKFRAEVTAAQSMIVSQFKEYMRAQGIVFSIDEHRPTKNKEERMSAILEPRYSNGMLWHYKGGNCQTLESELLLAHPEHDDIKDCLASVVEISVPIVRNRARPDDNNVIFNTRFGGVAYA